MPFLHAGLGLGWMFYLKSNPEGPNACALDPGQRCSGINVPRVKVNKEKKFNKDKKVHFGTQQKVPSFTTTPNGKASSLNLEEN